MNEEEKRTPNALLEAAISTGNPYGVRRALKAGADATSGLTPPLFRAVGCMSPEVMEEVIKAVLKQSEVYVGGALNKAQTEQAIARNLLDCTWGTDTLLQRAAGNYVHEILATVWPHFRGKRDINQPLARGRRVIHSAASIPGNLAYLLKEGADINVADDEGITPLMQMCTDCQNHASTLLRAHSTVTGLLEIYNRHADFHAVDKKGRTAIHHLFCHADTLQSPPLGYLDAALGKGVDLFARDGEGKTAIERFMSSGGTFYLLNPVVSTLARHGYNVEALARQYGHSDFSQREFSRNRQSILEQINTLGSITTLWGRLWNKDDTPSTLLLSICGYELLPELFEQPALKRDPRRAQELYDKMESKLPPQCKDHLHNGPDISWVRREKEQPRKPAALAGALKRKSQPKPPDGERQPGK